MSGKDTCWIIHEEQCELSTPLVVQCNEGMDLKKGKKVVQGNNNNNYNDAIISLDKVKTKKETPSKLTKSKGDEGKKLFHGSDMKT